VDLAGEGRPVDDETVGKAGQGRAPVLAQPAAVIGVFALVGTTVSGWLNDRYDSCRRRTSACAASR
jgi:hypothetical protein